jgi:hypothetical protein
MKLYVGAWSDGDGGVFVASGNGKGEFAPYELPCDGGAEKLGRVAFAILVDHLNDLARALALCRDFERAVGSRLRGNFWTLRESEVVEVLALLE